MYLVGVLVVGGTACHLAEFDGSTWTAIGLANSSPIPAGLLAVRGPVEGWEPKRLVLTGECHSLQISGNPESTIVVNLGQYTPADGFEEMEGWGINSWGTELG